MTTPEAGARASGPSAVSPEAPRTLAAAQSRASGTRQALAERPSCGEQGSVGDSLDRPVAEVVDGLVRTARHEAPSHDFAAKGRSDLRVQ